MSILEKRITELIARDLGIQPEQVTTWFIHELRKKMYADPTFQIAYGQPLLRRTRLEEQQWSAKTRRWAQEILSVGQTPCFPDPTTEPPLLSPGGFLFGPLKNPARAGVV
jgi:hypothetical protein